jgi:hypothetical protein
VAVATDVEIRGWQDGQASLPEQCIYYALRRVLGYDEGNARRVAEEYVRAKHVVVHAWTRENAERLASALQGVRALTYLAPTDCRITLLEAHPAKWGFLFDGAAVCERLTPTRFHVNFYVPSHDSAGKPRTLPRLDELFLSGIEARRAVIVQEREHDLSLDVALAHPMPSAAYVPDPKLARRGGISLETAIRIVGGSVIANWISEDRDNWYFRFFCIGPNRKRVSKSDGVCTRL